MKRVKMLAPDLKILGVQVSNYPNGYKWPYQVLIREAKASHPDATEVTIPGYGVLTFEGHRYKLSVETEYAREKGYPETIEGDW